MAKRIRLNEAQLKRLIKEAVERAFEEPAEAGYNDGEDGMIEDVKELCEREVSRVGAKTTYGYLFDKVLNSLKNGEISTVEELREMVGRHKDWAERNGIQAVEAAANEILEIIE